MSTVVDEETGEVFDVEDDQLSLFTFEGKTPDGSRHTITGSFSSEDAELPDMKLDDVVILRVAGKVSKVNHVRTKDGTLERQHVIVLSQAVVDVDRADLLSRLLPDGADSVTITRGTSNGDAS
jgi:hypothetical protein